ncbi:ADP-ribosyl cyclase/cyclic ADP-ribose hydrolase [Citrus sinensis]|uniref:ADP-ribosyl cyclase/cyclic ADP-ribose hydrolase n=1 Tax=Citrus sinensis TaxID=2711 RepID=A0ACB8LJZ7_CITSI|nr:ADP-ribosyl cyclase/cyclic ADP-ribose hydrolase [Citrus sinensis]
MANDATTPASFRLRWDVFLSFRGEDTRDTITRNLYNSLHEHGVRVFKDDYGLARGEEIAPSLIDAIYDSAASIIILSPNYGSSRWCLEELAKICELNRLILPVFYKVDPSDVRRQQGPFKQDFERHQDRFGEDTVSQWRKAMMKVGGISGWVFNNSEEEQLVQLLVKRVLAELSNTPMKVAAYTVGLDFRIKEVIRLLDVKSSDVLVLGLFGLGGIGKTTLAKAVYNKLVDQFEHRSFISNVRETSGQNDGLVSLQNKLIFDLSSGNKVPTENVVTANIAEIKNVVHERKVFVVLDDVDDPSQLNALCGDQEWFSEGSRIIITTRDRGALPEHYVNQLYEVQKLDSTGALQLFSYHALGRENPTDKFFKISEQIVSLTGGLPLALEVFGAFLFDKRRITEWEDALEKLRKIRPNNLQEVLKISFDGLDQQDKCIFLDIACLFVKMGMNKEDAIDILKGCGFRAEIAIVVLLKKSLIKITEDDTLWMHDQLRDMGRQIVQQESLLDPGNRSRLWDRDEIMTMLKLRKGTRSIQGIVLDFKKEMVKESNAETSSRDNLQRRFFVVVCKVAKNLMVLNLRGCWNLASIPDLSEHQKLEKLVLERCCRLTKIHESVGNLSSLLHLNLRDCRNLIELPSDVSGLKHLENLILSDCSKLKELPEDICSMRSLKELLVDGTAIEKLPQSIFHLVKLEKLNLEELPDSVGHMGNLEKLSLIGCGSITTIPDSIGHLKSLIEFLIDGTAVKNLPASIGSLSYLKAFSVGRCQFLSELPDSIEGLASLVELQLDGTSIMHLPDQIGGLKMLDKLVMRNCLSLKTLPDSIGSILTLTTLNLVNASITRMPESIGMLENLVILRLNKCKQLEKLPASMGKLKSLVRLLMEETAVTELPESFGMLSSLMVLKMKKPSVKARNSSAREKQKLTVLPTSFCDLSSLEELDAQGWRIGGKIPDDFEKLSSLEILKLGNNNFCNLPSSLRGLSHLKNLLLPYCQELKSLPPLPSSLEEVNVANCFALESICDLSNLKSLKRLNLTNCEKLVDISGLESLKSLKWLYMSGCNACSAAVKRRLSKVHFKNLLSLSMPGTEIPDWFSPDMVRFTERRNHKIEGVIIGVVVSLNHQIPDEMRYEFPSIVDIQAKILTPKRTLLTTALDLQGVPETDECQVYLCRFPGFRPLVSMLKDGYTIQVTKRNPPFVKGIEVKQCGIYLVYENEDDYDGDEESLDVSQQSVSEKLARFFSSFQEDE